MNPEIGGVHDQASFNEKPRSYPVPYFGWSHQLTYIPTHHIFWWSIWYMFSHFKAYAQQNFMWYSVECFVSRSSWHFFWHSLRHLEHVETSISFCFHIKLVIKPLDTQYDIIPVGEIPLVRTRSINQGTTLTSYVKSSKLGRLAHMKCVWKWMKAVACPGWFQQKFV